MPPGDDGDLLNYLIEYALENAPKNPDIAEDVLERFCDAVASNRVPDVRILKHLHDAFRLILAGEPAANALGLVRPKGKGKKRRRTLERMDESHLKVARTVTRYRRHGGMTKKEAIRRAMQEHGMSKATIKRAYETWQRSTDAES